MSRSEGVDSGRSMPELLRQYARIAIMGVGNELNGDDAVGVLVARKLKTIQTEIQNTKGVQPDALQVLILEAGAAPESFTGPLRRFDPDLVLMIDAAHLDEPPGSTAWFDWQETDGLSASTHTLPPSVLARFLTEELNCRMVLLGIQPEHLEFDRPVSTAAIEAVEQVVHLLADLLWGDHP